jgi:multiple sugar transport system substrate-binding protein
MLAKTLSRRALLRATGMAAAGSVLLACQPQVIEKVVKETVEVEKVVKETVMVEVEKEKEVTKIVEKVVEPTKPPKGEVSVSYMMGGGELSEDELAQFNGDNPGIKLSRMDPDQVRFFAMLAAGNPPDCYRLQAPEFPQLLARAIPLNLQPYFEVSEALKLDDLAPANNYYKANSPLDIGKGDIYGMCKDWSPDCTIWVNTTLFEKEGVDIPSDTNPISYDDVYALAQRMTKREGDRVLVWGFCNNGVGWIERYWEVWLNAIDKSMFSSDMTKFNLADNEYAKQCVQYTMDMSRELITQSPISPSPRGWPGPDFLAGQIAMMQYGFWYSGMVTGTAAQAGMEGDNKAIMIPAPIWGGGKRISTTITATGSVVARATKNPDEAWKAFEWYNGKEPAITRAKGGWGVPALKSLYEMIPGEGELRAQVKAVLMEELKHADHVVRFTPFLKGGEPAAVGAAFANYYERTLKGEFTFEQMIDSIQQDIDVALTEGIDRIL